MLCVGIVLLSAALFLRQYGKTITLFLKTPYYTRLHFVVIGSDDWHMKGVPSPNVLKELESKGYRTDSPWLKYSRETTEDLKALYAVLTRHQDVTGRPACLTANVVMATPDFDRIRASAFQEYTLVPTQIDWPEELRAAYRDGMSQRVFYPQLHGLDHIVGERWVQDLGEGQKEVRLLFDLGVYSPPWVMLRHGEGSNQAEYVDLSVKPSRQLSLERQRSEVEQAMGIFQEVFGFRSLSTIAPSNFFDDNTLKAFESEGIRYIQTYHTQNVGMDSHGRIITIDRYLGESTGNGGLFLARNCTFEPRGDARNGADGTLRQVKRAFRLHLPSIIDSHSVNFVSTIDPIMARTNLEELDKLLTNIRRLYPDVRFLTSPELGELIATGGYRDVFTGRRVELPEAREGLLSLMWHTGIMPGSGAVVLVGVVVLLYHSRKRGKEKRVGASARRKGNL